MLGVAMRCHVGQREGGADVGHGRQGTVLLTACILGLHLSRSASSWCSNVFPRTPPLMLTQPDTQARSARAEMDGRGALVACSGQGKHRPPLAATYSLAPYTGPGGVMPNPRPPSLFPVLLHATLDDMHARMRHRGQQQLPVGTAAVEPNGRPEAPAPQLLAREEAGACSCLLLVLRGGL